MASDKVQYNPTSHMAEQKKKELKRNHKWPEEKHAKLLCKQHFLEFTLIYGGLWHSEINVPGAGVRTQAGIFSVK